MSTRAPTWRWYDYLPINVNWLALTLRAQVMAGLAAPLLVQEFVGDGQKGAYYGSLRLWALMTGLLFQAFFGLLSDHAGGRWGRRRPFIFAGSLIEATTFLVLIWVARLDGLGGYAALFAAYLISMAASNMSQAGTQGLIPDLVPPEKRGRAASVKTLLEAPLPLMIVGLVMAPLIQAGNLAASLAITSGVLLVCMALTMLAREKPVKAAARLDWRPLGRLVVMTVVFTGIILALGQAVKLLLPLFQAGESEASRPLLLGGLGALAMTGAVALGVWASLRIQLGKGQAVQRAFSWWVISRLAALTAINNIATFLLYFLQEKFDLPGAQAAGLAGQLPLILGACIVIFGLAGGWLSDRYSRRGLTALSGVAGLLGSALMVAGGTVGAIYTAAVFIGAGFAVFSVASWALGMDIIPKDRAGELLGLSNLAGAGAGAIGAYIGGAMADATGYVVLIGVFGVMFLVSAGAALMIRA